MLDLMLKNDDITINSNGKLDLVSDSENVRQKLYILLRLSQGEFFYDVSAGLPYFDFFKGDIDLGFLSILASNKISGLNGIHAVLEFDIRMSKVKKNERLFL